MAKDRIDVSEHSQADVLEEQIPLEPMTSGDQAERAARWQDLPDRVTPDQMVEEVPSDGARDPDGGRNPDRDWMLRYS